jgi:hypothetical protein
LDFDYRNVASDFGEPLIMVRPHRIALARKSLLIATAKREHVIPGGLADADDIDRRIIHMRDIASAYLALMLALIGDLNDNIPISDKISAADFHDLVSDAFADASGAFRRVADRTIIRRPTMRRAS